MSKVPIVNSNLKLNLNKPKDLIQLKPIAFIEILLHTHRFWKEKALKPEFAYGILMGQFDGATRIINEAIPLIHSPKSDLVFQDDFFKHWDDLNALKEEISSLDRCIGWYKVIEMDMKFRSSDIRTQVKIQTLDKRNIALLMDPRKFPKDDEYGFSMFHLVGDRIFHEMCDYEKIPWEVVEVGADTDKMVQYLLEMIKKYYSEKPFVEELDEVKCAPLPPSDSKDDEREYVTPDVDPKQPFFL